MFSTKYRTALKCRTINYKDCSAINYQYYYLTHHYLSQSLNSHQLLWPLLGQNSSYLELQSLSLSNCTIFSHLTEDSSWQHPSQNGHLASNWTLVMMESLWDKPNHCKVAPLESLTLPGRTSAHFSILHIHHNPVMYS